MKSQGLVGYPGTSITKPLLSNCLLFLLAHSLCCNNHGHVVHTVHAANNGNPSTVRPIPATKNLSGRSPLSRRSSFFPSLNYRKAAKETYLLHVQSELESAQRQLYVSQNTCTTLRQRWEDQRRETLELLASRIHDADARKEEQQTIQQQKEEIGRLRGQFQMENEKCEQQKDRLNSLAAELEELQAWKEEQERSTEGKILQYEQQLQDSHQKQNNFAEQVELLALKLEAAEFAAKRSQREEGGVTESTWERRAQLLRSELEGVRTKYAKVLINSIQEGQEDTDQQRQVEEEMDVAIQSAVESALGTVEREWEMRYGTLEEHLNNMTEWATSLQAERDAALSRAEEGISSSMQSEENEVDPKILENQQIHVREELTAELTDTLTYELTEKLTLQLTETLANKIEQKYKKKYQRFRNELKEQQQKTFENKRSQEDTTQKQEEMLKVEMKNIKEQCELEYQSKFQEMQQQSEEGVRLQKERMRKLVQALLEREKKQKVGNLDEKRGTAKQTKTSSSRKKKNADAPIDGGAIDEKGDDEALYPTSSLSSSRKKKLSRPGMVPLRGNR